MIVILFLCVLQSRFQSGVNGAVELSAPSVPDLCVDQSVVYECNVTGSNELGWRVLNDKNVILGGASYFNGAIGDPIPVDDFTFAQLAFSPSIVSTVSFTSQSNIDGYSIQCLNGETETFSIQVPDDNPGEVFIRNVTNSSVNISWTGSPPYCNTTYRYNVSSTAPGWVNIISTIMNNNVIVDDDLVPSLDSLYYVTVTAMDQHSTRESNQSCFIYSVPPAVSSLEISGPNYISSNMAKFTITWTSIGFSMNCDTAPKLTGYIVNITSSNGDVIQQTEVTEETYTSPALVSDSYTVSVVAVNIVGDSEEQSTSVDIPVLSTFISSTPTTASSGVGGTSVSTEDQGTTAMSSSIMSNFSPITTSIGPSLSPPVDPPDTKNEPLSAGIIAGIAVGAGLVIAILVAIVIVLLIVYCCCLKSSESVDFAGSKRDEPLPLKETKRPISAVQAQALPETGQATYHDSSTIEHKQAHTGDLYAQPDTSSKRRPPPQPEPATYQDPDTIKRTQAHTGDLYAQPDKYSKKGAQSNQQVYADLEMHSSVSPRSPQPLIQQEPQQQVTYSAVHHY